MNKMSRVCAHPKIALLGLGLVQLYIGALWREPFLPDHLPGSFEIVRFAMMLVRVVILAAVFFVARRGRRRQLD